MKKKITALLAGIFALVITTHAQSPNVTAPPTPTVTFTATPAVVCADGFVTFTNTSVNFPLTWTWYFPGSNTPLVVVNGGSGNPPSPIEYEFPGSYNVTCVVKNGGPGNPLDSTVVVNCVTVLPLPRARVEPPYGGICTGQDTIYFHMIDTSTGNTYSWLPAAGLSCTSCEKPHASPTVPTVYTITVTGADGCTVTLYDTVSVGPTPNACRITGVDTICLGMIDTLTASGGSQNPPGTTYAWAPGGATTSSISVTPTHSIVYKCNMVYGAGGCTGSPTFSVTVEPKPVFTYTSYVGPHANDDSICLGETYAVINVAPPTGSPYEYIWAGPDMAPDTTDIFTANPVITTNYTLVVVEPHGCRYDSIIKIKVNDPPTVHFTGATDLCDGSSTTISCYGGLQYSWSTGQTTSSINITAVTGTVGFTYTVQVTSGGCFKDTSFSVVFDSMPHNSFYVFPDTAICIGDSVTIYASSQAKINEPGYQYTYLWSTGSTLDSIMSHPLTTSQVYTLTVTHGACSLDSAEIKIKVYPPPTPKAWPYSTTICQWDSVNLYATGGNYYEWSTTEAPPAWTPGPAGLGHYFRIADTDMNKASPPVTTIYTVYVCSWGCCRRDTITVNVTPGVLGFNVCCNETVSSGTPVNLSATFDPGPYQVANWQPATGLTCDNCANPTSTVDSTTKYVVTFLDLITGCTVKDSVTITIFNCNVFVPNAFSPNGDGVNDYLYVRSLCMKSMDFAVFDRFGNKVFDTQEQDKPWDGTFNGKPCQIGTYMWYLTGLLSDGTHVSRSGNVTLVR